MSQKDDPARLIPDTYPLSIGIRVLYNDMDGFRVVNNVAVARFLEEGRSDLNAKVFGAAALVDPQPGTQLMFATVTIDYLLPARYPGSVQIATGLSRIGSSSLVYAQAGFQGGVCFALGEGVLVKTMGGRSAKLSEEERAGLQALLLTAGRSLLV